MTKRVRVENADGGSEIVLVQVWQKPVDPAGTHVLMRTIRLVGPGDITGSFDGDVYVTHDQYLVVKEEERPKGS